jgi:hypothetical protein
LLGHQHLRRHRRRDDDDARYAGPGCRVSIGGDRACHYIGLTRTRARARIGAGKFPIPPRLCLFVYGRGHGHGHAYGTHGYVYGRAPDRRMRRARVYAALARSG